MCAKKFLGQNFLQNKAVLKKIADSADISEEDTVVEIGPGHGELTRFLLDKKPKKITTIEKDMGLAVKLSNKIPELEIIPGDAVEILPNLELPKTWKLVGNIPYYITGRLLRKLSEMPNPPKKTVLLIQKEVAERISSTPPKASLLSSVVQGWASAEHLFTVSKKNFRPEPKVDSAVISLDKKNAILPDNYFSTVRALFKQPRKKAVNNLSDSLKISKSKAEKLLIDCNIIPDARPQDIFPEDIVCIAKKI
ncbi:MAG: 16S rRNA (adenine(1518)-N(6)/adenine(1519)-N(6))-dimethyltransferase RsmA [Candidatus Colwellbacteria bacterium]|jgi:16S rRNA (adenine1518-N6/adenine1519-N6)-dimethyltransferase|nr:16S rRNA (adenine(1518)-N(6)/adenine(1519)-N(6))-dimethyltransferase RsmA [Candidatus Colwellbacteria bacterium]MCK9497219.1 16S rRNA (adenine(1518)-N(6)/adenine(1519)-N(6))-dimethyltransferase RsmA [Candidatus Colwellbacteria bacterium]MDD3752360.1 16S rRNA (adenine(1518)-N(6)/adenine(1519)-N(6))-dimethyltransferase RsmA [Candidatus Colwellbacteria bacterium]MDD4818574.1 16S rRNA (adenine(1518)-N(6)/adenine(1519)-N(6))-dimethyltransferase RsmA [Candidatus Colwellbacteria bacterium]